MLEQFEDRAMMSAVGGIGTLGFEAFDGEPNDVTITPGNIFTSITDNPNLMLVGYPNAEYLRGLSYSVGGGAVVQFSFSFPLIPIDLPNDGVIAFTPGGLDSVLSQAAAQSAPGSSSVVAGQEVPANGDLKFKVTGDGFKPITDYQLYQVIANAAVTHDEGSGYNPTGAVFKGAMPGKVITGNVNPGDIDTFTFPATIDRRYVVMLDQDNNVDGKITSTRLKGIGDFTVLPDVDSIGENISVAKGNAIDFIAKTNQIEVKVENIGFGSGTSYRFVVAEFDSSSDEVPETANPTTELDVGEFGDGAIDRLDSDFWQRLDVSEGMLVFAYVDTSGSSDNKDSLLELFMDNNSAPFVQADDGGGPGITADAINALQEGFNQAGVKPSEDFTSYFINLKDRDDRADLSAVSVATTVLGGPGLDTILGGLVADTIDGGDNSDVIEGGKGNDKLLGGQGDDTFIVDTEYGSSDVVYGGDCKTEAGDANNGYDTIFVPPSAQKNDISISLFADDPVPAADCGVEAPDSFVPGGGIDAIIDVSGVETKFKLPMNDIDEIQVSGGDGDDRLKLLIPDITDDEVVVYVRGPHEGSGAIHVMNNLGELTQPLITFDGIEQVEFLDGALTRADGSSRLVVFSDQSPEKGANDTINLATHLGAGGGLNLDPAIFPAGDVDTYQLVAQETGMLDFHVFFELNAALPDNGNLDVDVLDANGNLIASGAASGDGQQVTIPAVKGQVYFLRVRGAGGGAAVNDYQITVLNTPAPIPTKVVLDPADDSGASTLDQVTFETSQLHYYVHVDLDEFAKAGVPILSAEQLAGSVKPPGVAVELFREGVSVGFATAVTGTDNAIFEIEVDSDILFPLRGANAAGAAGYDGFENFLTAAVTVFDQQPTPAVGRTLLSGPLAVIADNVDPLPPSTPDLLPSSDNGQFNSDNVTLFNALAIQGTGEANSHVVIYANGFIVGQGTVGTDNTDGIPDNGLGVWEITTEPLTPASTAYKITAQLEDLAGNIGPQSEALRVLIDAEGPQVTDVFITGHGPSDPVPYNLFGQKPGNAAQGPTPVVNSLTIRLQDLPNREAEFFANYFALNPTASSVPGNFVLTGDATGVVAIQTIVVTNDPVVDGQPATASIQLQFASPLLDDRYTLSIKDSVVDPTGNGLDGESNADEPNGGPFFPSGNGRSGGDFVARFTVDSRPEIGTFALGTIAIDINGNFVVDPEGKDRDATNRDIAFLFGFRDDKIFGGNFAPANPPGGPPSVASGFDKLGAFGNAGTGAAWHIRLDFNHDGVIDFDALSGVQNAADPVAGNFAPGHDGDEVGLFNAGKWYLDTGGDNNVGGPGDTQLNGNMKGQPIVGDFDGDGKDDLGTWDPGNAGTQFDGIFQFDLASNGLTGVADKTIQFDVAGTFQKAVAADMNADGIDDIGLFVSRREAIGPTESAEWYFLVSNRAATGAGTGNVNTLNHPFTPIPFGNDIFAQFGDEAALPVVGNFDPPVGSGALIDNPASNLLDPLDVNHDGNVSPLDVLMVVNYLNAHSSNLPPTGGFALPSYLDVTTDGNVTALDALIIINRLNASPESSVVSAEGESVDAYFSGSDSSLVDNSDALWSLLASDAERSRRRRSTMA
jgi:hypothetical protein